MATSTKYPYVPPRKRSGLRSQVSREKFKFASEMRQNQTPEEQVLWDRIKHRQFGYRIKRQNVILGWIVDFYCGVAGLVIEVDGRYHANRSVEDARRDDAMRRAGLSVLRFTNEEVTLETDRVVKVIVDKLSELGYPPR